MIAPKRLEIYFPVAGGFREKFIREFVQNKAEICEDELRLAEIQLSFSDKIFKKFYCSRQELLLDYNLSSLGQMRNLKIIFYAINSVQLQMKIHIPCILTGDIIAGLFTWPFIFRKMLFMYSFHFPPSVM